MALAKAMIALVILGLCSSVSAGGKQALQGESFALSLSRSIEYPTFAGVVAIVKASSLHLACSKHCCLGQSDQLSCGVGSVSLDQVVSETKDLLGSGISEVVESIQTIIEGLFGAANTFATQIPSEIEQSLESKNLPDKATATLAHHHRVSGRVRTSNAVQPGMA